MPELPRYKFSLLAEFETVKKIVSQANELNYKNKNMQPIAFLEVVIKYLETFISAFKRMDDSRRIASVEAQIELLKTTGDILNQRHSAAEFQAISRTSLKRLEEYLAAIEINAENESKLIDSAYGKEFRDAFYAYKNDYPATFTKASDRNIAKGRGTLFMQ